MTCATDAAPSLTPHSTKRRCLGSVSSSGCLCGGYVSSVFVLMPGFGHPDGVFGDRRAGGFLRHPSIGWADDDFGADSRHRRVDPGDCLASDPNRDGVHGIPICVSRSQRPEYEILCRRDEAWDGFESR
jgi:hypothetical protein